MLAIAARRRHIVIISWLVVLSVILQSFSTAQAQTIPNESAPNVPGDALTNTLPISATTATVGDTAPALTLTPPITLSLPITTPITQVVSMTVPDVQQDKVIATLEPPKAHGKQEAVHVPAVSGDIVRPPKKMATTPATQPLYVVLDWGKLRNGKSTQVKLDLQVITPTASPIDIVLTLPAGLTYDSKSSKVAVYDAAARTLTWRNVDTQVKKLLSDAFRVDVDVPTAPALLQASVDWHTVDAAQRSMTMLPLNIGALHASNALSRKTGGVFKPPSASS